MKLRLIPVLAVVLLLQGCGGKDVPTSGTVTVTNELFGSGPYYAMGFSFAAADLVSTLTEPYDIDIKAGSLTTGGPIVAFLSANTLEPSFALKGEYGTESAAISAFKALTSVGAASYIELAAPLKENQVWVVRTEAERYAKIRIIQIDFEPTVPPYYASCQLEWVFQPDGSTQFP
jgi:hypothetical protein